MKKFVFALFVTLWITCLVCFADKVTVTLNGTEIDCEKYGQEAVIENGRTLVPLRSIFESLGASVEWIEETKTVVSVRNDVKISLAIGDDTIYKNGVGEKIDVAAKIVNNRTLVPVRAVAQAFGVQVSWEHETRTAKLFDVDTAVFSKGVVDGDVYTNSYLDIGFCLPEGYYFFSGVDIKSALSYLKENGAEIDINAEYEKYEFAAADKEGNNVQVTAEKTSSVNEVFTAETYEKEISDKTFTCFNVTSQGAYQTVAVAERGEYTITMLFTYKSDRDFSNMLQAFK